MDLNWGSGLRGVGGSDIYASGLALLLFQRSADEDILLLLACSFGVMDGQHRHSTKHTPIYRLCSFLSNTEQKHVEKAHQQVLWYLCLLIHYWQLGSVFSCSTLSTVASSQISHSTVSVFLFHVSDELCEGALRGDPEGLGSPGVHRSFVWGGTPCFRKARRPYSRPSKDLHAGVEIKHLHINFNLKQKTSLS